MPSAIDIGVEIYGAWHQHRKCTSRRRINELLKEKEQLMADTTPAPTTTVHMDIPGGVGRACFMHRDCKLGVLRIECQINARQLLSRR